MKSEIVKGIVDSPLEGKLYKHIPTDLVVLCTCFEGGVYFSGVVIVETEFDKIGAHRDDWVYSSFTLFTGEIKLTQ